MSPSGCGLNTCDYRCGCTRCYKDHDAPLVADTPPSTTQTNRSSIPTKVRSEKKTLTEMQCAKQLDAAPPPLDEPVNVRVGETLGGASHRLRNDERVIREAPCLKPSLSREKTSGKRLKER